jgi:hypothetical protein
MNERKPDVKAMILRAREATTQLRDAARQGRVIDFRQRDALVMAIHDALDLVEFQRAVPPQEGRE